MLTVTRRLLAATIYVMACASLVTVSALAPFNHYPAYVTSVAVPDPAPASTARPATTTPTYEHYCRGRPDGHSAAEPGTKCRRYFRCHGAPARSGHQRPPSIYLCPGKLVFNGLKCVHSSEYQCHNGTLTISTSQAPPSEVMDGPKDCAGRADGYYQDGESGCRSYFFCTSGHKAVYVCPSRMLFDGQRCVEAETYRCPFASSDCRMMAGSGSGYFGDAKSGCRSYHFCSDGQKLVTLTCSDNKIFDGRKCVDPAHYRCPSDDARVTASDYYSYSLTNRNPSASFVHSPPQTYIITNKVNAASGTQRAPPVDECEKSYGFFVIPGTGCRQYYFCIAGSRTDLTCSGDTVFNGQVCVPPAQFYCPEEALSLPLRSFDCRGKADGVYPDVQSGCVNYFLCHEEQSSEFACPHGQLFDGRKCSDARSVVCVEPEADVRTSGFGSNVCHGRANGLYTDDTWPECRGFVYCRSGRQLGPPGQCGLAERFSEPHSRCLPKSEVFCATNDNDEPFIDNSEIVTTYYEHVEATTLFAE